MTSNCSITSSTLKSSRFSMTVATGMRVSRNTHAPLTLPGMLSTVGHWDQSRVAMFLPPFIVAFYYSSSSTSQRGLRGHDHNFGKCLKVIAVKRVDSLNAIGLHGRDDLQVKY